MLKQEVETEPVTVDSSTTITTTPMTATNSVNTIVEQNTEHDWVGSFAHTFIPGAAHGATSVLLGHPFDTAKTRMQALGPHSSHSLLYTLRTMAQAEGLKSLYRGVVPPLLVQGSKRSIQFALWDVIRFHGSNVQKENKISENETTMENNNHDSASPLRLIRNYASMFTNSLSASASNPYVAGAIAGGFGTLISCPIHVLKIQTQYMTAHQTRNAWTCAWLILHNDGIIRGFYRGWIFHAIKDICFAGLYLGTYASLRDNLTLWWVNRHMNEALQYTCSNKHKQNHIISNSEDNNDTKHDKQYKNENSSSKVTVTSSTQWINFVSGATSAMVTWTFLFPLDTFKTLAQAKQLHTLQRWEVWQNLQLLRRRLYRGLSPSLIRAGPVSGIAMMVYEFCKANVKSSNRNSSNDSSTKKQS